MVLTFVDSMLGQSMIVSGSLNMCLDASQSNFPHLTMDDSKKNAQEQKGFVTMMMMLVLTFNQSNKEELGVS